MQFIYKLYTNGLQKVVKCTGLHIDREIYVYKKITKKFTPLGLPLFIEVRGSQNANKITYILNIYPGFCWSSTCSWRHMVFQMCIYIVVAEYTQIHLTAKTYTISVMIEDVEGGRKSKGV